MPKRFAPYAPVRRIVTAPTRFWALASALTLCCCLTPLPSTAQNSSSGMDATAVRALVRVTIANEVSASSKAGTKLMYRSRKLTGQGSETRLSVETTDSTAWLLLERNNRPLSEFESQQDLERLAHMSGNPGELRRKKRVEREEADHSVRIMEALPDAFLYQFDGTETATENLGKPGDELVRLKFRPNPVIRRPRM